MRKKDVLTTGQVARICNVAPRTVSKWFDSGQLKGYKIPGSKDRRIPLPELMRFMKQHDMPLSQIEDDKLKVLIIDYQSKRGEGLAKALGVAGSFDVKCADNIFEAGLLALKFSPSVILIDLMNNEIDARQICSYIQKTEELQKCSILALAGGLTQQEAENLLAYHFSGIVTDLSDIGAIVSLIEDTCLLVR